VADTLGTKSKVTMRPFLDASTAHISKETGDWLSGRLSVLDPGMSVMVGQYGWFVWVGAHETVGDMPADLRAVLKYARAAGADYLMLDADAPKLPDLTTHEW